MRQRIYEQIYVNSSNVISASSISSLSGQLVLEPLSNGAINQCLYASNEASSLHSTYYQKNNEHNFREQGTNDDVSMLRSNYHDNSFHGGNGANSYSGVTAQAIQSSYSSDNDSNRSNNSNNQYLQNNVNPWDLVIKNSTIPNHENHLFHTNMKSFEEIESGSTLLFDPNYNAFT